MKYGGVANFVFCFRKSRAASMLSRCNHEEVLIELWLFCGFFLLATVCQMLSLGLNLVNLLYRLESGVRKMGWEGRVLWIPGWWDSLLGFLLLLLRPGLILKQLCSVLLNCHQNASYSLFELFSSLAPLSLHIFG